MKSEQKKYDLHIHSKYSACSNSPVIEILKRAKKSGLNGIAITDHNKIKGAVEAKKLNKDRDFEVIVGSEIKTDNGEILAYYLNKEIKPGKFEEVVEKAREQGALVAIAHPYAEIRKRLRRPFKSKVDAVECFNQRMLFNINNIKARQLAEKLKVAKIAGSDSHFIFEIGNTYTIFDEDLRKAVLTRKTAFKGVSFLGLLGTSKSILKKRVLDKFKSK